MKISLYDSYVHQLCNLFVKKTDKVFDCGCGSGSKTIILSKYSDDVIGGDLDKRIEADINFRKISDKEYGSENEFDAVFSFDVIEHVQDDLGFLKELARITRPGGVVVVGTPNRNRLSNKIISLIKGKIQYPRSLGYDYASGGDILHLREYTKSDLIKLATAVGNINSLEVKTAFLGLYTPFGPVGLKKINPICDRYAQHLFLIFRKK